jgi:uncharacterized membrane protein YhaH (DUF805 family)
VFAWYTEVLRKYTVFSGRAGRPEYWWFTLANIIIVVVLDILGATVGSILQVVGAIYGLAVFLPSLGVSIRRLHDTNRSGWWILIGIVPLIGWIVLLVFYCSAGTPGDNNYGGEAPTEPGASY